MMGTLLDNELIYPREFNIENLKKKIVKYCGTFCSINVVKMTNPVQRRIENPVKHLRWSYFAKIVNR